MSGLQGHRGAPKAARSPSSVRLATGGKPLTALRSGMPRAAAAQCSSGHPAWVLLDTPARIGPCENATTARSRTSAGHGIAVSFSVTRPPAGLSRCFVHCPGLTAEDFIGQPRVTGADGALLLIRVTFAVAAADSHAHGPGEPSLHLLPRPYPVGIYSGDAVGALSCGGEHHRRLLIVVPEERFDGHGQMYYDLQVFSSETMSWSTRAAAVAVDGESDYGLMVMHEPRKVVAVGGTWLAWIDLRRGVLLCNVADDDELPAEMRLIQLPSLMRTNRLGFQEFDGAVPPLRCIRDVTCRESDGLIMRLIEIEYPELMDDSSDVTRFKWTATMFTREIISSESDWNWSCTVDSDSLSPTDTCLPGLFPEIWDGEKLTLDKVISSSPTLDLYNDDVFYMMAKLSAEDSDGWVLAVNARDHTLENVVPFANEEFDFEPTYRQCAFSKHLSLPSCAPL